MVRHLGCSLVMILAACGSDSSAPPKDAQAMRDYLREGVILILPRLGGVGSTFPVALNPGTPGSSGISFTPDNSGGAPPNSYTFSLDYDGDGDGAAETFLTGGATFNGDPATAWEGFAGHVTLDLTTVGGLGQASGALDFSLGPTGGEVSGSGSFFEGITGNTTTVTVDAAHPLHIEMARGTASSTANACASSLDGSLQMDVAGPTGTMTSTWGFQSDRKPARVTNASFTDGDGKKTNLPDADVSVPCGQSGGLSDWTGAYLQNWACVPAENGSATLTLTGSGGQVQILDEDPPGSGDVASYSASVVSGNPHVVRGFFIGGPPGNTYREDFSWILAADGSGFSQISKYVYQEGAQQGSGGYCGGWAARTP